MSGAPQGIPTSTHLAVLAAAITVLTACGEHEVDGSPHVTVDTLAGGVVRVTNSVAGTWGEGEGWTLREDLRIGLAEGSGPEVFGRVMAIEADETGQIYVLDGQAREVRIFGPEGNHLRTLGREGEGPGEFRNPVGLSIHPGDGNLWVIDPGNARYTVFDRAGALVGTHPRPFGFFAIPWPGGFDADARLHDVGAAQGIFFARLDGDVSPGDTFPLPTVSEEGRVDVVREDGTRVMSLVSPLAPRLQWTFDPRGFVWTATSDAHRFIQQTLAGDTLRVVTRVHEPAPVTRTEADSVREAIEATIAANAGPGARVDGDLRVPDYKPAFRTFLVDRVGRLWVEPYRRAGEPRLLEVFATDGAYLGPIVIDPRMDVSSVLPRIGSSHLHAVVTDELGVPYVVRYRLEPGS